MSLCVYLSSELSPKQPQIYDLKNQQSLHILTPANLPVLSVDACLDRNLMACGSMDGSVVLYDLNLFSIKQCLKDHARFVVKCAFSITGQFFASISYDKSLKVYELVGQDYRLVHTAQFATNPETLLFIGDAWLVYTRRDDYQLHYLELTSFATSSYNLNERKDTHVSFSMYGLLRKGNLLISDSLASALHPSQKVISLQTGPPLSQIFLYPFHSEERITTIYVAASHSDYSTPRHCWTPDGSALVVNSDDGFIYIVRCAAF